MINHFKYLLLILFSSFSFATAQTNHSLSFDGLDDYVRILDSETLQFESDFSLSVWYKLSSTPEYFQIMVSKQGTGNPNAYGWMYGFSDGSNWYANIENQSGQSSISGSNYPNIGSISYWHNGVFVFDQNNNMSLYLDGELLYSTSLANISPSNDVIADLLLGSDREGQIFLNGKMDEISIWDKALTQQEIQSYISTGLTGSESNLVSYWNFNEGEGTSLADLSGNGNHGTINGATWSDDGFEVYIPDISLVINEIMNNPSAVSDSDGEWFEIYNNGDASHDLNGWTIKDNNASHIINNSILIHPGDYKIFSNNSNQNSNGGVVVDYEYGSITLANSGDEIVLIDPSGTVFDSVAYDNGITFPDPNGASMALVHPDSNNTIGTNWQESTTAYGDGNLGTPGLPNFSSDINVELATIDFDTVLVGEFLDKVLTISNTGNTILLIDSIYTSSGLFTLPFTENSIDDSLELTITFTPSAYGIVEDTLVIKTNDPDEGHIEITLIAFGYVPSPNIVLGSTSIDFGTVMDGLAETIELHVANDGDAPLSLSSVYIEGSTTFTIPNFSASIAETDTGLIDIQFSPDDETSFSGTLYIVSNDPDTDSLMVPLSGIGGEQAPIMTLSDNELYFGLVEAGTTVEREVIIYNEGILDLEIEEITITGSDYYTTTFSDAIVEQGDSIIVPFSFAPTEQVSEVMAAATVASNVGTQTIELKAGYFGPVWHVATTGSDETGDGSEATPFATIQKGLDMLASGDTVFISAGEYYSQTSFTMCDFGPNNITIMGDGMSNTFIGDFIIFGNRGECLDILENSKINIENFKFEGDLGLYDIENINIKNVWSESYTNINNFSGYNLNQVVQISNSIFQTQFNIINLNLSDPYSQQINFNYCTFTSVETTENSSVNDNSNISFYNSILDDINFDNDEFQADINFCFLSSDAVVGNDVEGVGNIYGDDPLFCDLENGDFSLAANSPAVGAGENGTDIGAFGVGCESTELSIDENVIPDHYTLHQNYPNPFNPTTKISYDLPEASFVTLSIYDLIGREIRTMINSEQTAGFKNIQWNATDNLGKSVPAGMYIYTIQAGQFRQTRKMVLLK